MLVVVGVLTGLTTVLFGFGGGFVTVPAIVWVDAAAGREAAIVAVATSSVVMVVNAVAAAVATPSGVLRQLRGSGPLLLLLGVGGLGGALAATSAPSRLIHWGFATYLTITLVDMLARPGFLRPHTSVAERSSVAIPVALGVPIGAVASFLGVGGSVMTVPLLRRSGLAMGTAAALANPLTACISIPACAAFLTIGRSASNESMLLAAGTVDLGAAALLLLGALPVVTLLRRRPPQIPDRLHAWGYVALLLLVLGTTLIQTS